MGEHSAFFSYPTNITRLEIEHKKVTKQMFSFVKIAMRVILGCEKFFAGYTETAW